MKKFGTFGGVFTPTLLTILGVIMYLRLGWVVGNAGLLGAWLIILLAYGITICTALSMSSITTNIRIGAGGAYAILRTSWVVSAHGSNFVKTMRRLATKERRVLQVVADQYGGPTPAQAIADAALDMIDQVRRAPENTLWGTYHFCGAPAVSWHQFATAILADLDDVQIEAIPSSDYLVAAPRPANSVLDCSHIRACFNIQQPDWKSYLDKMLVELADNMKE